jgi:CHASE3 domain sensor protein
MNYKNLIVKNLSVFGIGMCLMVLYCVVSFFKLAMSN